MDCPKHIEEQSIWRLDKVKEVSPACFNENKCINCGCDVIEESFGPKGCDYGCYPALMQKEQWEQYKKDNKIQIQC